MITSTRVILPVVTVPVLSSTMVSTLRVDSSTSGPLIRMPICAPRPVPTSSAVGVASPSAQGQAMISTATAAVNAAVVPNPAPNHTPSVPTAIAITIGTNTPEIRSARRWTSALPDWASSTSFAICASWVSGADAGGPHDQAAAGVDGRTGDGVAVADLDRHGLAGEHRFVDRGHAGDDHAVGGDLLAGPDDELVADSQVLDSDQRLHAAPQDGDLLGAEFQQGPQGGAGAALGALLEVAAEQDERDHAGGDFEVDVPEPVGAGDGELERVHDAAVAGGAEEQRHQGPDQGRSRAHGDERVHGRGPVTEVHPGSLVERPARPHHHRGGQHERRETPIVELQGGDHRHRDHRHRQHGRADQPLAQGAQLGVLGGFALLVRAFAGALRGLRERGGVAGLLDLGDQGIGVKVGAGNAGLLGRVVDAGVDAVELVQLLLDPVRARGAGHPADLQLDTGDTGASGLLSGHGLPLPHALPAVPELGIGVLASGMSGAVLGRTGGRVDHQRGGVHLAVDLEVQVEQVPTGRGRGGLEHDLRPRGLAGLGRVAVRVDVQVGEIAIAEGDKVPERAQVRLQCGDRLAVTGDGDRQLRRGAGDKITLHSNVEAVDGGLGDRPGRRCRLVVAGHLHRGRVSVMPSPVSAGTKSAKTSVAAGGLPLPGDRPGAIRVHLGVDVAEVLPVGAHHDQVQLLLVLQLEIGNRVAIGSGDRQRQLALGSGGGRCGHRGELVAVLGEAQAASSTVPARRCVLRARRCSWRRCLPRWCVVVCGVFCPACTVSSGTTALAVANPPRRTRPREPARTGPAAQVPSCQLLTAA